jgi:HK97 family phage major capsid protein
MSYSETNHLAHEFKNTAELFKQKHGEILEEVKSIGSESKENRDTLNKMHDRLDMIETQLNRPKLKSLDTEKLEKSEYAKAFMDYMKKGYESSIRNMDVKVTFPNLNETIDPDGGYLVPPEFSDFIVDSLVQWSPIRRYATVLRMNRKEFKIPVQQQAQDEQTGAPAAGMFATAWGSELVALTQTNTGLLGQKTLVACDLNAYPFATTDMLDDFAYGSLETYIQSNIAKSFAYAEGKAFVEGDGLTQPTGLLTDPSIYVNGVTTGSNTSIGTTGNLLINAYYTLPDFYARNGTWFMNRQTIRIVREWVDGQGQYLWTPTFGNTLSQEAPGAILGRPYQEIIDMPGPTAIGGTTYTQNDVPILFGDMRSAYYIGDRIGMTMLRDPYSNKPFISYWFRSRVAGNVILPEALCKVTVST